MSFKDKRKATGLTQLEAAKLCNVSLRTWEHWENGRRRVPSFAETFIDYIKLKQAQ